MNSYTQFSHILKSGICPSAPQKIGFACRSRYHIGLALISPPSPTVQLLGELRVMQVVKYNSSRLARGLRINIVNFSFSLLDDRTRFPWFCITNATIQNLGKSNLLLDFRCFETMKIYDRIHFSVEHQTLSRIVETWHGSCQNALEDVELPYCLHPCIHESILILSHLC